MLGSESEFEAARRLSGEPSFRLLGDVRGMIVEDQLDRGMSRIGGIENCRAAADRRAPPSDHRQQPAPRSAVRSDDAPAKPDLRQRTMRRPGTPAASAPARPGSPVPFATVLSLSAATNLHPQSSTPAPAAMPSWSSTLFRKSQTSLQRVADQMNPAQLIRSMESIV